ncbi:MAG: 2'-5' RNA ligase family protein [Candidatus Rokuibacteriota bacterium]
MGGKQREVRSLPMMRSDAKAMTDYRDHHATIFVSPEVAGRVEALRREWDPRMARQIAAHVTLAYPREAPTLDLLVERVRAASTRIAPFRLRLGEVACFERPEGGVYLTVDDIDGGYREMREHVLRPPFRCVEVPPHVTLVHPRTSRRGRDFWDTVRHYREDQEFTTQETTITAFDGVKWVVLMAFRLGRGQPRSFEERRP